MLNALTRKVCVIRLNSRDQAVLSTAQLRANMAFACAVSQSRVFRLLLLALKMYRHAIQLSESQQTTPTCM